ncbi:RsfA family transcriptional regulator [Virgibacillus ainsalahensis]
MNATRQDAWTNDEDAILAETVLHYIRDGKTQLEAFKEVAKQLSRTSAACGFRWNATIRKEYNDAIQMAKEDRKHGGKRDIRDGGEYNNKERNTIETAILLLEKMKSDFPEENSVMLKEQERIMRDLEKENEGLKHQLQRYDHAWEEMGKLWRWVKSNSQD